MKTKLLLFWNLLFCSALLAQAPSLKVGPTGALIFPTGLTLATFKSVNTLSGDVSAAGNNLFTGTNLFGGHLTIDISGNLTADGGAGVTGYIAASSGTLLIGAVNGTVEWNLGTGNLVTPVSSVNLATGIFSTGWTMRGSSVKNDALYALGLDATDYPPLRISNNNGYVGWTVGSSFSYDGTFYVFFSDLTQTTYMSKSIDGFTWSEPFVAPQFFDGTVGKNFCATAVGVQLTASGGTLPTFWAIGSLTGATDPPVTTDTVHTLYKSTNLGVSWTSLGTLPPVPTVGLQPSQYTGITQMADGKMAAVWGRDGAPFTTGIIRWPVTATDTTSVTIPATISSDRAADAQLYSDSAGAIMALRWDATSGGAGSPYAGPKVAFSTDSGVTWVTSNLTNVPANDAVRGGAFAVTRKSGKYILMAFNRFSNGAGQGGIYMWSADDVAFKAAITGGTPSTAGALFTLSAIGNVPGHYSGSESAITGQGALVVGTAFSAGGSPPTNANKLLLTFSAGTDVPAQGKKGDVYGQILDFDSSRIYRPLTTQADIAALRSRRLPTIIVSQTTVEPIEMQPNSRYVCTGSGANYLRPDVSCQLGDVIEIEKGPGALNLLATNGFSGGGIVYTMRDGVALAADGTYTDSTAQRKTVRMICTAVSGTTSATWMIDDEQGALTAARFNLPTTTSAAAGGAGTLYVNSARFLHSYSNGGSENLFAGANAGNLLVGLTGSYNVGIGSSSMVGLTSGVSNVGVGQATFAALTTSGQNVAIGTSALSGVTTSAGGGGIGIGYQAGATITTGAYNTIIGRNSDVGSGTSDNNTILGANATTTGTLTHSTVIGADATSSTANSITLGRAAGTDTVRIPGALTVSGAITGNGAAITSVPAATVSVANEGVDATCFPIFITNNVDGQYQPKYSGALNYDPTNGTLAAAIFSGSGASLTGIPVSTGISGLGTGVAGWLAAPATSAIAAAQFTKIELGHNTDTSFTRVSAGVGAIEGNNIVTDDRLNAGTLSVSAMMLSASGTITDSQSTDSTTVVNGMVATTTATASSGNQKWSPALVLSGKGWGTTAGTSQATDWQMLVKPTQGTVPTSTWALQSSIAGGAFADRMTITSNTAVAFAGPISNGGNGVAFGTISGTTGTFSSTTDSTTTGTGSIITSGGVGIAKAVNIGTTLAVTGASTLTGALTQSAKTTTYNAIPTAGIGVVPVLGVGRVTAQSAANSNIVTYTAPASDGSYEVSMNMNVSAVTAMSASLNCDYTDESNTARTMIFPVQSLAGNFVTGGLVTATGPYETPVMHIRVKASTAIKLYTSAGTYTGVTYTAEGIVKQSQ